MATSLRGKLGGNLGEIVSFPKPNTNLLKTGLDYLKSDYPEYQDLGYEDSTIDAVALIDRPSFQNPLDTVEGVHVFRGGQLIIEVTNNSTEGSGTDARFQVSSDGGSTWNQANLPSRSTGLSRAWRFSVANDGQTIFAWYLDTINNVNTIANVISYDNGVTWDDSAIHALIANTGNHSSLNGSTIIGAVFSEDNQELYLTSYTAGIIKLIRNPTSGIFDSASILWENNLGASLGNTSNCLTFIIDDVDPSEPSYNNIIACHSNGVIVVDNNGVLLNNITGTGQNSVRSGLTIINGSLLSIDGGISWEDLSLTDITYSPPLSTFLNSQGDICDIRADGTLVTTYIFDVVNKIWSERKIQNIVNGVGSVGANFVSIRSQGDVPVIISSDFTINASYVLVTFGETVSTTFHIPFVSNDLLDSRGSSTVVVRVR